MGPGRWAYVHLADGETNAGQGGLLNVTWLLQGQSGFRTKSKRVQGFGRVGKEALK